MHRLLVATAELEKDSPTLSGEAANHLRVLRPKDGEAIELFDGRGRWRACRYVWSTRKLEFSDARRHLSPSPSPIVLFACVTKGSRWDWTIEKATELGVTRIVPVVSERTIVRILPRDRAAKKARWTRIAEEAARQSDAKWIPEVLEPVPFEESLSLVRETTCLVGALTDPPPPLIGKVLARLFSATPAPGLPLSLYVGPEGDFAPVELSSLLRIATPVGFGSTILRAETAAIYGISAIKTYEDTKH